MEYVSVLFIFFLILLIIAICVGFIKILKILKAKYSQGNRKEKIKFTIVFISVILVLVMAVVICYNITHKQWIVTTNSLKENFSEISSIYFEKPTPMLYIRFSVDDTTDFNRMEEIFAAFLNELDEELLNELIQNAGAHAPGEISVWFSFTSDEHIGVLSFISDHEYDDWRCDYPIENNSLYGKEYKVTFECCK